MKCPILNIYGFLQNPYWFPNSVYLVKKEEVGVVSMLILVFSFGSVYDVVVRWKGFKILPVLKSLHCLNFWCFSNWNLNLNEKIWHTFFRYLNVRIAGILLFGFFVIHCLIFFSLRNHSTSKELQFSATCNNADLLMNNTAKYVQN